MNYTQHLLILFSKVTACVSISVIASLAGIHVGITSSAVILKICAIIARIKEYNWIIKTEEKTCENSIVNKS